MTRCLYWGECKDEDKAEKGNYNTKCYRSEDWMKCLAVKFLKEHV